MFKTFRFIDFKVYKDAKEFYKAILEETRKFPKEFLFDITSQLRRYSLSVVLNIAEGSAKKSDKDFNRFIEISLGSINEAVACLEISFEINLLNKQTFDSLILKAENITRQLGGFSKRLKISSCAIFNGYLLTVNCCAWLHHALARPSPTIYRHRR